MNYKFQVGDLVRWGATSPGGAPLGGLPLGLVIDLLDASYDAPDIAWYKILIQGYTAHVPEHELTKAGE